MIRPVAFMGFVLLSVLAFAVFQVENRVQDLRGELRELNRQIKTDREAIHVLKAEWTYLTKPGRLQEMSDKYLDLEPITPEQVRNVEDIPLRPVLAGFAGGVEN